MKPLPGRERWSLIAPLLEQALETPPERRGAFLDQACGEDPGLRAEVEALLAADSDAGAFLGVPVDVSILAPAPGEGAEAAADATRLAGTYIGAYKVVREIGRGGMGVIYEAEQQRPRRSVALKVILGGRHVDAETVRMFQRESDSLARLKHPSIASIYESGCTEEGQHFFAMELVEGRTLDGYLAEGGAPATPFEVRRRLALFRKIAAAVAYAHQRGVIHRDLKPSNILVLQPGAGRRAAAGDGSGGSVPSTPGAKEEVPDIKILDFGLARITEPDAEAPPTLTIRGSVQGTLPYMSPEQVRGRSDEIDVRTDVYSLGVLLYRMLSGRLPYDLEGAEITEAARIISEQPPRPLGTSAGGGPRLDRDLAIIVHKAPLPDRRRTRRGRGTLPERPADPCPASQRRVPDPQADREAQGAVRRLGRSPVGPSRRRDRHDDAGPAHRSRARPRQPRGGNRRAGFLLSDRPVQGVRPQRGEGQCDQGAGNPGQRRREYRQGAGR
jgi:serine/threonine protein kinase